MMWVELIVVLLGLSLGSFLGACAYRIPRGISIITVASTCPRCRAPLRYTELIPLASFMIQAGKCHSCSVKIPWRYPLYEIAVASGTLLLFQKLGATPEFLLKESFLLVMVLIFTIDWEFRIIPNRVLLTAAIIGIILKQFIGQSGILESAIFAFISFGIVYLVRSSAKLVFKKESLGMGDVKLAWVLGFFVGLKLFLIAFWAASVLGAIYGLLRIRGSRSDTIPFGSFLAVSTVFVFTFDEPAMQLLTLWMGK